ncbi:hypothetical protein AX15_007488 [Amanita polypyramis BW_CC]|nr:hypothetical protein AX15_007488 [Amanita polypyramis BW_CC]
MSSENSELDSHSYSYYSDSSDYYSTSSMSTPSRRSISDAVPTVSGMKDELKRDVDERFVDDKLDVKDFVRHVWGVDQGVIDTILNAAEDFKSTLLDDLIDGYKNAASDREQKAYTPFSDLADYLSGRLQAILPRLVFVNRLYSRRGELVINSGENKRKPDTIIVPKEYQGKYDWKHVLVPFEFKTRDKPARQQTSRLSTPSIAPPSGLSKVLFPPGNGEDSQPFDGGLPLFPPALPHSKPIHANAVPSDGLPGSSRMSPTAGNAADKGDVTATTHAPDQSIPRVSKAQVDKKPKATKGYSSVDSQRKAITVTSSTGRSKKIDINQQPLKSVDSGLSSRASGNKRQANDLPAPPSPKRKKSGPRATGEHLQLARYALECMATASRHYVAGVFIHRFNISLWYYDRAIVARTVDFDFETQPEMLALVLYGLFTCDSRHAGFDPFIIPASHPCPSNIDQLFEAPTSMVQSKDDQIVIIQKDGPVKQYKITDNRLFANRCLVGRGTVVLPVQAIDEGGISDEKQVVKISWPAKKRIREACLIRKLHQAIPEMAQHLPDITSFSDIDPEQLRLPRNCLNINVIEDFERNLHVVAMKRYKALWDVDSVEEFKNVFVDCVECTLFEAFKSYL